jgi:hypothetical protein
MASRSFGKIRKHSLAFSHATCRKCPNVANAQMLLLSSHDTARDPNAGLVQRSPQLNRRVASKKHFPPISNYKSISMPEWGWHVCRSSFPRPRVLQFVVFSSRREIPPPKILQNRLGRASKNMRLRDGNHKYTRISSTKKKWDFHSSRPASNTAG